MLIDLRVFCVGLGRVACWIKRQGHLWFYVCMVIDWVAGTDRSFRFSEPEGGRDELVFYIRGCV